MIGFIAEPRCPFVCACVCAATSPCRYSPRRALLPLAAPFPIPLHTCACRNEEARIRPGRDCRGQSEETQTFPRRNQSDRRERRKAESCAGRTRLRRGVISRCPSVLGHAGNDLQISQTERTPFRPRCLAWMVCGCVQHALCRLSSHCGSAVPDARQLIPTGATHFANPRKADEQRGWHTRIQHAASEEAAV